MKKYKKRKFKIKISRLIILLLIFICFIFGIISIIKALFKEETVSTDISNSFISQESQNSNTTIHMSVIGDIMCHTNNYQSAYNPDLKIYDFSPVFKNISSYIDKADIAIGNLETTFAGEEYGYSGYPTFNSPSALGKNLKEIGIDILCTANNHSIDKGYNGIVNTLNTLDEINIDHIGTARNQQEQNTILIKDVNGIRIAFLAYTYGTNGITIPSGKKYCINLIDKELILKHISMAKEKNVDLICVNMHWGDEYKLSPNKTQEELADFLFENGVDIILGSHPHVLEPMEKRTISLEDGTKKDVFLIYSLGNFFSAQTITNTKNSIILDIQLTKHSTDNSVTIDSIHYTPIYCYDKGPNTTNRYQLIDVEKAISNYENGNKDNISDSLYETLKNELSKIVSIIGEEIY